MMVKKIVIASVLVGMLVGCNASNEGSQQLSNSKAETKQSSEQVNQINKFSDLKEKVIEKGSNLVSDSPMVYKPTDYIIGLDDVVFGGMIMDRSLTRLTLVFYIKGVPYYYAWIDNMELGGSKLEIYIQGKKLVVTGVNTYKNLIKGHVK